MSKRTLVLIAVLAVIASVLVVLALSPKQTQPAAKTQNTTQTPSPTSYPVESVLTLNPNPLVIQVGATTPSTITVDITTGQNDVTAVQLELSYDPKLVSVLDATPGTFFDNPLVLLKTIDEKNGRMTYAFGIQPSGTGKKGSGTVAKITVQPVAGAAAGQSTNITVLPKSLVTATGLPASVLKSSTGTSILLVQPNATAPKVTTTQ